MVLAETYALLGRPVALSVEKNTVTGRWRTRWQARQSDIDVLVAHARGWEVLGGGLLEYEVRDLFDWTRRTSRSEASARRRAFRQLSRVDNYFTAAQKKAACRSKRLDRADKVRNSWEPR